MLQSRVADYRRPLLEELLYTDHQLLDGWDKQAGIYPVTDWPYFARHRARVAQRHGDPSNPSMHGLFVVAGPRIRQGARVPAFENIHLYDFFCAILGIRPAPNDGDPAVTRQLFRN